MVSLLIAQATASESIRVALLTTSESQMAIYSRLFAQFESHSGIKVDIKFFSDITFKKHVNTWVEFGNYDVLYWQGGDRLKNLVDQESLLPIDELIDTKLLQQQYRTNALNAVSYYDHIFALPLGQYIWGLYYNKDVFKKLKLSPPANWHAFKQVSETLKSNGIKPLVQATQDGWPVLAWLDYFALDIGGPAFRQSLLNGEFGKANNKAHLLEKFQYLAQNDLFFAPEHVWRWDQTLPALLREQAAMTLLAQFVEDQAVEIADEKIGFIPFPFASNTNNSSEVSPMELLVVTSATDKKDKVSKLLEFIVNYAAVDSIANDLGWLSVSNQGRSSRNLSERTHSANQRLAETEHLVQYFDRETSPEIAQKWASAIVDSFQAQNIQAIESLELKRYTDKVFDTPTQLDNDRLLSISTIKGFRGSYAITKMLSNVYQTLGFEITVNRFDSTEASINSLNFGADGELARLVEHAELNKLAIKIDEPLIDVTIYLVGKNLESCALTNNTLPKNAKLSMIADSLKFHEWAQKLSANHTIQQSRTEAFGALIKGEVDYTIAFASDLPSSANQMESLCVTPLETVPVFHYLSRKNAAMANEVSLAIKQYKSTAEYKSITDRLIPIKLHVN